jgi:hypothetical protein
MKAGTLVLGVQGISMIVAGSVYAFSQQFTPWHRGVMGEDIPYATQKILWSLYRVAGWSGIACGIALLLMLNYIHKTSNTQNREGRFLLWLIMSVITILPTGSTLMVSFQVGWRACPWYMPALGLLLIFIGLYLNFPSSATPPKNLRR